MAQWCVCLACMKPWVSFLALNKCGLAVQDHNSQTSGTGGHPWLHRKFEATWATRDLFTETKEQQLLMALTQHRGTMVLSVTWESTRRLFVVCSCEALSLYLSLHTQPRPPGPHLPAFVGSPVIGVMFGDVGVDAT